MAEDKDKAKGAVLRLDPNTAPPEALSRAANTASRQVQMTEALIEKETIDKERIKDILNTSLPPQARAHLETKLMQAREMIGDLVFQLVELKAEREELLEAAADRGIRIEVNPAKLTKRQTVAASQPQNGEQQPLRARATMVSGPSSSSNVNNVNKEPLATPKGKSILGSFLNRKKKDGPQEEVRITSVTKSDFTLLTTIGHGAFGQVLQVKHKASGKIFAMKVLLKKQVLQEELLPNIVLERNILSEMNHPFIVSLRFSFQSRRKLYMVLDYINGGDLAFHLMKDESFNEDRARIYAAELVLALEALHSKNYIYRDVKPDNILVDEFGHIRLTDFGLSKMQSGKRRGTFCGTPSYLAPEVILERPYGCEIDWWGLGVLTFEMMTGKGPFRARNVRKMYENIVEGRWEFPPNCNLSMEARDLIHQLLIVDQNKRLGAAAVGGVAAIKRHPFFAKVDWDRLILKEITPPWKPEIKQGSMDVSNVSDEVRKEAVREGWTKRLAALTEQSPVTVPDFSFVYRPPPSGALSTTSKNNMSTSTLSPTSPSNSLSHSAVQHNSQPSNTTNQNSSNESAQPLSANDGLKSDEQGSEDEDPGELRNWDLDEQPKTNGVVHEEVSNSGPV